MDSSNCLANLSALGGYYILVLKVVVQKEVSS